MKNRLQAFISQLDRLVVFMAAGHSEVFDVIRDRASYWLQGTSVPDTFLDYQDSVYNAAFLLGYAHFEAFLCDLTEDVYLRRPSLLPKKREVKYEDVLIHNTKEEIVLTMVNREIREVFSRKIEDVMQHFEQKLAVPWPSADRKPTIEASKIRNCLMHNGGVVDGRLADCGAHWAIGNAIRLDADRVHQFGIMGRRVATFLWDEATRRHLSNQQ